MLPPTQIKTSFPFKVETCNHLSTCVEWIEKSCTGAYLIVNSGVWMRFDHTRNTVENVSTFKFEIQEDAVAFTLKFN